MSAPMQLHDAHVVAYRQHLATAAEALTEREAIQAEPSAALTDEQAATRSRVFADGPIFPASYNQEAAMRCVAPNLFTRGQGGRGSRAMAV